MKTKMMTGLIAVAFVCFSILLLASCAQRQTRDTTDISGGTEARTSEVAQKGEPMDEEAMRAKEAEEARLREQKKAQKLSDEIQAFESESIYFDFDMSTLKQEAQDNLKQKANWLNSNPSYKVRIDGHCDERGTNEYNLALGERRAHAAKKFLMALGISEYRISTISYGEEKPADSGNSEAAWALNRRDEFKLIKWDRQ